MLTEAGIGRLDFVPLSLAPDHLSVLPIARFGGSTTSTQTLTLAETSVDLWTALLDVLILLTAAILLGTLCERLKQSAIIGYLLAGTLLGPNALDLMPNHSAVAKIAELGVALLLFTLGLEFSWRRLRTIGPVAIGGGAAQVLLTGALVAGVCLILGTTGRSAVAVGAMVALSSTACVLRLLISRAEIDGIHGRNALGILLLQDIAVVPLVLLVSALGGEGADSVSQIGMELGRSAAVAVILAAALFVLLNYLVPFLLGASEAAQNRDLPILLAMTTALGAAWVSHKLGLSPVFGAFLAGLILAESPFVTRIRADVAPLRTLFVTLFFSSIGMLCNPAWVLEHWLAVGAAIVTVVLGKTILTAGVVRFFKSSTAHALATGVCLAQVGEFSFILAEIARRAGVIGLDLYELMVATTIGTLFLSPYLVAFAPRLARFAASRASPDSNETVQSRAPKFSGHILIIGFGPAGQRVAETLMRRYKSHLVVLEMSSRSADVGRTYGLTTHIGDATHADVLESMHVEEARAVVVTIPDPSAARLVIEQCRALTPGTPVIARARYHVYRWELLLAGAETVIDEEDEVGFRIAAAVRRRLRSQDHESK